jgi:ubiquinone/menaquinone biosynthesis C-methylase UbiE
MQTSSEKRAAMPKGTAVVLDARTLEGSNANLLQVLKPGQKVLDAGCGTGAITQGICKYVGDDGLVIGLDSSKELITLAQERYTSYPQLQFVCEEMLRYETPLRFDVITTTRTLQWIANPIQTIRKLVSLLAPGGMLCVLDYNHTQIQWTPEAPAAMQYFYDQFLHWRADAGMDNAIGDHVAELLTESGLRVITTEDHSEYFERGHERFEGHMDIWLQVAKLRGPQLVNDGYVTEEERLKAIEDYSAWCAEKAQAMKLVLKAVHGVMQ